MNEKQIHGAAHDIQRRVIQAIDDLITSRRMKSLSAWCAVHDLNRVKYSNLRSAYKTGESSTGYKLIDIDVLAYLVNDFGVNADWLITGEGSEFK